MITIHSIAIAAVAGTLMDGASTAFYLRSDEGVPLNQICRSVPGLLGCRAPPDGSSPVTRSGFPAQSVRA